MWKELLKSLPATMTSVLSRTSIARLGGLIVSQIPHCTEQYSSQMPWVSPPGGMGGFGIDCYIISDSRIWILRPFSKISKWIMNLKNPYSNSNLSRRFTKSRCAEGIIHAFCRLQTRKKDTLEIVFVRKCQTLCFHAVLFSGLKRVL